MMRGRGPESRRRGTQPEDREFRKQMMRRGKTIVLILSGRHKGRLGWIWGDIISRRRRNITTVLVHQNGYHPYFRNLDNLREILENLTLEKPDDPDTPR